MSDRQLLEAHIAAKAVVEQELTTDLRAFWDTLDPADPVTAKNQLVEVAPLLVADYGQIMATLAAEYFEDAVGRPPVLPDQDYATAVSQSMRWAAQPLFDNTGRKGQPPPRRSRRPDPSSALARALSAGTRHARQQGRDVIHESVAASPGVVYARVPRGAQTCAFCLVLASRGFTYGSRRSAGGEGNKFHGDCDCEQVPSTVDNAELEGYDVDALYEQYAAAHSPGDSIQDVTAKMRRMYDIR